jgi:hypothetical protein
LNWTIASSLGLAGFYRQHRQVADRPISKLTSLSERLAAITGSPKVAAKGKYEAEQDSPHHRAGNGGPSRVIPDGIAMG